MCVERERGGGVRVFGFILAVFPEPAAELVDRMSSPDWPVTSAGVSDKEGGLHLT